MLNAGKRAPGGKCLALVVRRGLACEGQVTAIGPAAYSHQRPAWIGRSIGDEPHDESDSRFAGCICIRAVNNGAVMKRHLAGLQYDIKSSRFINSHFDSLTADQ